MKSKAIILITILAVTQIFAHRVLMMIDDNADGTITIETGLSSGGNAGGSKVVISERSTGRPLSQSVVPESGVVTTKRPSVPYSVSLLMDQGHAVTQAGPDLLPIESKKDSTSLTSQDSVKQKTVVKDSVITK